MLIVPIMNNAYLYLYLGICNGVDNSVEKNIGHFDEIEVMFHRVIERGTSYWILITLFLVIVDTYHTMINYILSVYSGITDNEST